MKITIKILSFVLLGIILGFLVRFITNYNKIPSPIGEVRIVALAYIDTPTGRIYQISSNSFLPEKYLTRSNHWLELPERITQMQDYDSNKVLYAKFVCHVRISGKYWEFDGFTDI